MPRPTQYRQPCPGCERPVRVSGPDQVGSKITCPRCGTAFAVKPEGSDGGLVVVSSRSRLILVSIAATVVLLGLVGWFAWPRRATPIESDSPAQTEKPQTAKPAPVGLATKWDDPLPANTFVVVAGVSSYADSNILPRPKAEVDARALARLFAEAAPSPKANRHVTLLVGQPLSGERKATRQAFLDAVRDVVSKAGENDLVVLAFLGQGAPFSTSGEGRCYLFADSTLAGRLKDGVPADEIEAILGGLRSKRLCALLDVNFRGWKAEGPLAQAETTLGKSPYRELLGDDGTAEHLPLPGRVLFLATNGLSASPDLAEHGLFTTALLEGLRGKADTAGGTEGYRPDGDQADGLITVDELSRWLNLRLFRLARENGAPQTDHFVLAGKEASFVLASNPAASAEREARLSKLEAAGLPAELAAEGRGLLARMPRRKELQSFRAEYVKLLAGEVTADRVRAFETRRAEMLGGLQLPEEEVKRFAADVTQVIGVVRDKCVREVRPAELTRRAVRALYELAEEPVPAAVRRSLEALADGDPESRLTEALALARAALGRRESLAGGKDLAGTLQRMLATIHSIMTYYDTEALRRQQTDLLGSFSGVGMQIRKDVKTDYLLVVTPIRGSPALKAGVEAGDLVTKIIREADSEGRPLARREETLTNRLPLNKATQLLMGKAGTKVAVEIQREGEPRPLLFELVRGTVASETALGFHRTAGGEWDYLLDREHKIAYIRIPLFTATTPAEVKALLPRLLKEKSMRGLILDVRFNSGGNFEAGLVVASQFAPAGSLVTMRPREGVKAERRWSNDPGPFIDLPMAVLVNGYTAGGCEVLAAALQDHRRAFIVGERSNGFGCVSGMERLDRPGPEGKGFLPGAVRVITATIHRPDGRCLHRWADSREEDDWGVRPGEYGREVKVKASERRAVAEHQREVETIQPARSWKRIPSPPDAQLDAALEQMRGVVARGAKKEK